MVDQATVRQFAGRIEFHTDDEDTTIGELCDMISELIGCKKSYRLPTPIVAGAAMAGSILGKLIQRNNLMDWDSFKKITRDLSFDSSRIRDGLGYHPLKTLREGLREEIDWLLSQDD